jgi:hypothetical protein
MNALGVLLRTEGLGLQEAVDALCGRLALIEDAFFDECAVLRAGYGGQPGMAPYLDAWGLMLSGNMAWSLRCPRYHGAGGGWDWQQGAPELMELFPDRTVFSATSRGRVPAMG